ncbi:immunoglobulin superfamily member 6 isoform X2 [Austrofundulus limnaeus]|uniref:immunoglobulin superfamily member 6 isoform X2 n=1 Tax=Austrofundulus limnaeus TaxID=52670 RepID=UPI0006B33D44|nr:PREDICTED: immunoglobulin superfamily member 6-like isoform X2 [Austrofundulus limnaeus]
MRGLFWLSLLLTHVCGTESTEKELSCLSQPHKVIFRKTGQSAVLPCIVSNCSSVSLHYQWFVFREKHHLDLQLTSRHSLDGASLQISALNANDSGIYHCAITSTITQVRECCRHHVGRGTTLVVKEHLKPQLRQTLLWSTFTLLAIFNLALVAFIVIKKHGCKISTCKKPSRKDKENSVRKTAQFRYVLQELHSRGTFTMSKQRRRDDSRVEEASGENISTDDIYQNV